MIRILFCLVLLVAPLCATTTTTVNFYNDSLSSNVPTTVWADQIELVSAAGVSPGYYRIDNVAHFDFEGTSEIGFMRFRYGDDMCGYFYRRSHRGTEDPINSDYESIETWSSVYWAAYGDGTLVDGAQWGSDNYILMRDSSDTMVAVLQFLFDEDTYSATLIASAVNFDGLTFTEGVNAIEAAAIPEPSTYAAIFGAVALGAVVIARRRQSKRS